MAIITLLDKIIQALKKGEYTIGIFWDFSQAFDTVNHKIPLAKLDHYGIRGIPNKWVESYLYNREQICNINGSKSRKQIVKCGVPQESILGPLLFLIYINDLGYKSKNMSLILFADD
jgi:hypothetical protein